MQTHTDIRLRLVNAYRAEQIQHASDAMLAASARRATSRRPVRRVIGHGLMRFGARLASEPTYGPARAR
jgi:hypothetical protein